MHLSLNHQNLNIFNHFGDSAQNENNTTRAFLIAATRSAWSPILLRGFFDLVAARIRERLPDQAIKRLFSAVFLSHGRTKLRFRWRKILELRDSPASVWIAQFLSN
jgi:hypothetical protein